MGWLDNQATLEVGGEVGKEDSGMPVLEIKLPGGEGFIKVNRNCVKQNFDDSLGGPLLLVLDEVGELMLKSGLKNEESKAEDALKSEIEMIITSICQLSRSAAIALALCTQRPDSKIISGNIKNNPLSLDTRIPTTKDS